jgi:hypothetical protein
MAREDTKSVVPEIHMLPCAPSSDLIASFNLAGWSVPLITICDDFILVVVILAYKLVVTCAQCLPFGTQGTCWCFDLIFWPQIWVLIWNLFRFAPIQCFVFKFHCLCNAHSYCDANGNQLVSSKQTVSIPILCLPKQQLSNEK